MERRHIKRVIMAQQMSLSVSTFKTTEAETIKLAYFKYLQQ